VNLGKLLDRLRVENPDQRTVWGWSEPHIYKGCACSDPNCETTAITYVAFVPDVGTTVGHLLASTEWALGKRFQSGSDSTVVFTVDTPVFIAKHKCVGMEFTTELLDVLFSSVSPSVVAQQQLHGYVLAMAVLRSNLELTPALTNACVSFIKPHNVRRAIHAGY